MTLIFKEVPKNRIIVKLEITNNSKMSAFSVYYLQFSKLTNSFEKLRLHQMKQNKLQRKEVPHLKEEIPFEPSNLNQKLEVSYIFLVSSLKIDFCCGGGGRLFCL